MKQTIEALLSQALFTLQQDGIIPQIPSTAIQIDRTKDRQHGDYASNIALTLAKSAGMAPRQLAEALLARLPSDARIEHVAIAGPGFINFYVVQSSKAQVVADILQAAGRYGDNDTGRGQKILLEFVSANPNGPLHVGHGRGAAFGATLANILRVSGYQVSCEYYVNDAGRQMNILAASVYLRYLTLCGEDVHFPANGYQGTYVTGIAGGIFREHDRKYLHPWHEIAADLPPDEPMGGDKEKYVDALIDRLHIVLGDTGFALFHSEGLTMVLKDIQNDLAEFGVTYDHWFSEKSLMQNGDVSRVISVLEASHLTYEKEGALWFKATDFGDEKDRVLLRANGVATYFACDAAYHWNKYQRGFDKLINVFGADHHGYVARVRAAVRALGHSDDDLRVFLIQFAILYRSGERVQMSTRSGSFVTLRQLREEVGNDAARFFYVMRKHDQHMDFDLDLAKSQSNDNPVYYIQYAHARIASVLRQMLARDLEVDVPAGLAALDLLQTPQEILLLELLARYPEVVAQAAQHGEPHSIAYYLRELANALHSYYNAVQLLCEAAALRAARVCLLQAVQQVLAHGLTLLGVSRPETM